jgi:hypothetical protein
MGVGFGEEVTCTGVWGGVYWHGLPRGLLVCSGWLRV